MRFWGPGNVKNVMKQTPMCQLRDIRQQTAGNTSFKWDSYAKGVQWWGLSLIHLLTIFPLPTGHSTVLQVCHQIWQNNKLPQTPWICDSKNGGFNPFKIFVKLEIFPNFRGENNKYLKSPPRWVWWWFFHGKKVWKQSQTEQLQVNIGYFLEVSPPWTLKRTWY